MSEPGRLATLVSNKWSNNQLPMKVLNQNGQSVILKLGIHIHMYMIENVVD